MADIINVTALNRYVKQILDCNEVLYDLAVSGEIANFVRNSKSGHCYFSLRDAQSSVRAVMFRSDAQRLGYQPQEGMKVVVRGRITLYERDGTFQIIVSDMFPAGIGSAQIAFEQLKARLEAEGLFDAARKKPLPSMPQRIGLVTSKTGAALQDILNVTARRWPMAHFVLCPVNVQGFEAAQEIADAIRLLDAKGHVDVIIVARGGGSREDLWVFNAEAIAQAAYACKTPLVSAIGHEIDFTILDFVADLRAPTPSAAAELVTPDAHAYRHQLCIYAEKIQKALHMQLDLCYNQLETAQRQLAAASPARQLTAKRELLSVQKQKLQQGQAHLINQRQLQLAHSAALMRSLSPYRILSRGYAMVKNAQGELVAVDALQPGAAISLVGDTATAQCIVNSIRRQNNNESTKEL